MEKEEAEVCTEHRKGKQLTLEERCVIQCMSRAGASMRKIAKAINCSPSTVLNEMRRGRGERRGEKGRQPIYTARRGQKAYEEHREKCRRRYAVTKDRAFIEWMTKQIKERGWSIDACVGYARRNRLFGKKEIPCTKTLYNAVWEGRLRVTLFDLPEALGRKRNWQKSHKHKRIFGRSIEERAEIVGKRTEFGHWEIDTVVGKRAGHGAVVLTLVEKKTDYCIAVQIPDKTARSVQGAMAMLTEKYGKKRFERIFKTVTSDNGLEFSRLAELERQGVKVYFAHPYASYERGQNERHNRLLRRYIPRGLEIERYSEEEIVRFAKEINALPRKILNYRTPEDIFNENVKKL